MRKLDAVIVSWDIWEWVNAMDHRNIEPQSSGAQKWERKGTGYHTQHIKRETAQINR
jgi:hypothetical protein